MAEHQNTSFSAEGGEVDGEQKSSAAAQIRIIYPPPHRHNRGVSSMIGLSVAPCRQIDEVVGFEAP